MPTTTFSITNPSRDGSIVAAINSTFTTLSKQDGQQILGGSSIATSSSSGGGSTTRYFPFYVFKLSGLPNGTSISSAILRLAVRLRNAGGGNDQPSANDHITISIYNNSGPTPYTTYAPNLVPNNTTDFSNIFNKNGFTQAYRAVIDTGWTHDEWRTIDFDVTDKLQSVLNTFDYTNAADILFAISTRMTFHGFYGIYTSSSNGERIHFASNESSEQEPLLIIETGSSSEPDPMKITFD